MNEEFGNPQARSPGGRRQGTDERKKGWYPREQYSRGKNLVQLEFDRLDENEARVPGPAARGRLGKERVVGVRVVKMR